MADSIVVVHDYVSVEDAIGRSTNRLRSDAIAVTDSIARERSLGRRINEDLLVQTSFDMVTAAIVRSLKIASAVALTSTRVRVNFSEPAVLNAALTQPSSYVFDNVGPTAVDVVPVGVRLPAGQATPAYVEVETTEHTNQGSYTVGLTAALRGVNGEVGSAATYAYQGIGSRPALKSVLATSPTTVEVHFTEAIAHDAAALSPSTYGWGGGTLQTLAVQSIDGKVVTLQTSEQAPGQLYTLQVQGE